MNVHIATVYEEKEDFKSNVYDAGFTSGRLEKNYEREKPFNYNVCDATRVYEETKPSYTQAV